MIYLNNSLKITGDETWVYNLESKNKSRGHSLSSFTQVIICAIKTGIDASKITDH